MSFTPDDMSRLQEYIHQNSEASDLFQRLLEEHNFELHKICHELRNPLTLLSGTLQLIETQHPETKTFAYWDTLCDDLHYMEALLSELSQYNNSSSLTFCRFSLRSFLERLVLSFAASLDGTGIEFTSQLGSLPEITGDKTKLQQALFNLLRNAKEAMDGCGTIFLSANILSGEAVIEIRDSGCGMTEQQLQTVFTPFITYKSGGTGLGLPIVKNIIEAHHGHLSVTSSKGHGTCFRIFLPV